MFNLAISPHHFAGVTLLCGLAIGGYFAYKGVVPPSLEEKLRSLNVQLLSDDWTPKAIKYKTQSGMNLIPTILASNGDNDNSRIARELKGWCQKKRGKYFFGETDETYKSFSVWCTVSKKISEVLVGRGGLKSLDEAGKKVKVDAYNSDSDNKFITKIKKKGELIQEVDLENWCKEEQNKDYLFENEEIKKIISWCYKE